MILDMIYSEYIVYDICISLYQKKKVKKGFNQDYIDFFLNHDFFAWIMHA